MNPPDLHAMPDDPTRALPHAVGPEKSVLSSILQDPQEFLARAAELGLRPEHFYDPGRRTTYEILQERSAAGEAIEFVGLVQHMLDIGKLERVGGPAALSELYTYTPAGAYFNAHVRQILDKHVLREMIRVSNETIQAAYDAPGEAMETLDEAERSILAIRDDSQPKKAGGIVQAVNETLNDILAVCKGDTKLLGMTTGFPRLDSLSGGLKPGEMFVIAARPSMGKTALMMNIVEHVTFQTEQAVQVFSCEMSEKQIISRLMLSRARFNAKNLQPGHLPDQGTLRRIQHAAMGIAQSKLMIDDTPAITITDLRAKARRARARHDVRLIAIDYLQLLRSATRQAANSREREIGEISAGIKAMAKELGVPVIVLAQLNRESEKRSGKSKGVPRMSDLRESGTIEQDADLVGLLTRDAYYADDEEEREEVAGKSRLILAKNRSGETGDVWLTFLPELVRFETGMEPQRDNKPQQQPNLKKSRFQQ